VQKTVASPSQARPLLCNRSLDVLYSWVITNDRKHTAVKLKYRAVTHKMNIMEQQKE